MKIYCIKIDSMPFRPEVLDIAKIAGGTLLRQVSGAYTLSSLIQMFTGQISSDFEPQGVGYYLWKTKRDENGVSKWSWMKNYIQFCLSTRGFSFINRNSDHIINNVLGFGRYSIFTEERSSTDDGVAGRPHNYLASQNSEWLKSRDREFAWIDEAQSLKGNIFFNIDYGHFHAAVKENTNRQKHLQKVAGQNVLELINHYDFSEPDALFWIYSDHGAWYNPTLNAFPFPEHFYTWSIVRDNSDRPLKFPSKVISIQDFYSFILYKFNNKVQLPDFSKERIYFTEDGRAKIDDKHISTAIACRFERWENDFPFQMNYLIYHKSINKFAQRVSELNDEQFMVKTKNIEELDENLFNSLKNRFSWVPDK